MSGDLTTKTHSTPDRRRRGAAALGLAWGLLAYGLFAVVFVWLIAFLAGLETPRVALFGPGLPGGVAIGLNAALVLLFAAQHSAMARPAFKAWLVRHLPRSMERSTYVLASDLALGALLLFWQPVGPALWEATGVASALLWAAFAAGWLLVAWTTFLIDHLDLFGLRQVWLRFRGRPYTPPRFQKRSVYRYSRNPMHVGTILAFWATQAMTFDRLVLAVGMTLYTLAAVELEERDLERSLGPEFRAWRREVPKYLGRRRAPEDGAEGGRAGDAPDAASVRGGASGQPA